MRTFKCNYQVSKNATVTDLLLIIANTPSVSIDPGALVECGWCGVLDLDEYGNYYEDGKLHHKHGCPVLRAREVLGAEHCPICGEWEVRNGAVCSCVRG